MIFPAIVNYEVIEKFIHVDCILSEKRVMCYSLPLEELLAVPSGIKSSTEVRDMSNRLLEEIKSLGMPAVKVPLFVFFYVGHCRYI